MNITIWYWLAGNPMDQFDIVELAKIHFNEYYYSLTNSTVYMTLVVLIIIFIIYFATFLNYMSEPTNFQSIVEEEYIFVKNIVGENTRGDLAYFPLLYCVFNYILCSNLIGLIPYSFTVTSHLIVTLGLSSMIFIGATIIGFTTHKIHFFSFFLPPGAPLALAPILVVIEIVSYTSRVLSLAIRLFANMMSGHSLLHILAGFVWVMIGLGGLYVLLSFTTMFIISVIFGLELGIAFLQAYVFLVLSSMYIAEAKHLH